MIRSYIRVHMIVRDSHLIIYNISMQKKFKNFTPCQLCVLIMDFLVDFLCVFDKVHIMSQKKINVKFLHTFTKIQ